MPSTLLDESVPLGIEQVLTSATISVTHASRIGLPDVADALVPAAAEEQRFDILVTCDQNLTKQQNINRLPFGVLVVRTNNWPTIRRNVSTILIDLDRVRPGAFVETLKGAHLTRYGRTPTRSDP